MVEVPTPVGTARVRLRPAVGREDDNSRRFDRPRAAGAVLFLGHGAGGGPDAPDLRVVADVAGEAGVDVALVDQPYRVAGRRSPAPAPKLDAAWVSVVEALVEGRRLLVGGRSSGARVACRTANDLGAAGVLCLAFPLRSPGRPDRPSRLPELKAPSCPVLVVQGRGDPFGVPRSGPGRTVVRVDGDHALKKDLPGVAAAVRRWLPGVL